MYQPFTHPCMQQYQCKYNKNYIGAKEKGVVSIDYGDESALKTVVALKGPVSAAVDARSSSFRVSPFIKSFC